jgi:Flp pilus assembly pilin Flp
LVAVVTCRQRAAARRIYHAGVARQAAPSLSSGERMRPRLAAIRRWMKLDDGQDLIEYGLIAALIATGAILTMTTVGSELNSLFWVPIANAV